MGTGAELIHPLKYETQIDSSCLLDDKLNNLTLMNCGVGVWQNLIQRNVNFLNIRTIFICSKTNHLQDLWLVINKIRQLADEKAEEPEPVTVFGPIGIAASFAKLVEAYGPIDTKEWLKFHEGPVSDIYIETFPVGNGLGICIEVDNEKVLFMENAQLPDLERAYQLFGKVHVLVAGIVPGMTKPAMEQTYAFTRELAQDVIIVNVKKAEKEIVCDLCLHNSLMYGVPMMMIPF